MEEILLKVTISEANVIISGLAKFPFEQVVGLISNLQQQAAAQINPQPDVPGRFEG